MPGQLSAVDGSGRMMSNSPRNETPPASRRRSGADAPLMASARSSTARSPPRRRCQYPCASITVSGAPGRSSAAENQRPISGRTPSVVSTPRLAVSARTSSGSPLPVIVAVAPGLHTPTS